MNPTLRRNLVTLLTGTAATLAALLGATWLQSDACRDRGGRWADATRTCDLPAGAEAMPPAWRAYAIGALAGLLVATVLWRTYTFFALRGARRAGA